MRSNDHALLARMDQWNALLDALVERAAKHSPHCPDLHLCCPGGTVSRKIDALEPVEARTLAELGVFRLARPAPPVFVYEPSFHCWTPNRTGEDPDDHEHDSSIPCDWGWRCNADGCNMRTDTIPCPEHAPTEVPALRLVECQTDPRHWLWAHRNQDYGHGCPWCDADRLRAELEPLKAAAARRVHRWCWLTNRAKRALIRLRLMRHTSSCSDCRYRMWHTSARWRWERR